MIIGQFNLNAIILYFIICDCETDNFINIYVHTTLRKAYRYNKIIRVDLKVICVNENVNII